MTANRVSDWLLKRGELADILLQDFFLFLLTRFAFCDNYDVIDTSADIDLLLYHVTARNYLDLKFSTLIEIGGSEVVEQAPKPIF